MRFVRWSGPRRGEGGSLPLAMLLTTVALAATAAMVPIVVKQANSTGTISSRTSSMEGARSGMDVALGQIRAAIDGSGAGALEELPPCQMDGAGADGAKYTVTITYYGLSPSGAEVPMSCPPLDVPVSAKLTVTGTGGTSSAGAKDTRTLEATYKFKTSNENISGGAIRLDQPTNPYLCLDAGGSRFPGAGAKVMMEKCVDGASDQRFAYTADLNIKLVQSETSTYKAGLCLDAPMPRKTDDQVTFQPCLGRQARQQWSLDNSSNFRSTSDGINLDSFCLNLKSTASPNNFLVIGGCGGTANKMVFRPQAGVGAGMASRATGQLVNFKQFSRCLDVTNHDVNMSYMIVWFCKQAPDGNVSWNQRWDMPAQSTNAANAVAERIRTTGTSSPGVCLKSPRSTASNKYVTVTACSATGVLTDNSLKWTTWGDTGDYTTSYRIVDADGHCLTPTDLTVTTPDTHTDGTAKAKVADCTDSLLQKWNAPANFTSGQTLSGTQEK
ncbi:ricin-type beta-trefoil lectin domain protein [Krasilnikovia sp. MM14-A1004]|uniref:ricin-type beta-trefoil lectin domain protein n=1 Tax=Krasilnikovia sp. MM14-A1004 TaxID=3373541 RepID=UPI00399C5E01